MGLDQMLLDFEKKPPGTAFPNIPRTKVVGGLRLRLSTDGAKFIAQKGSSLCGPAAVMFCVANRNPEMYAQYVMDLYDKGEAQFGTLTVKPGDACRNYDPKRIAPVDWIALVFRGCITSSSTLALTSTLRSPFAASMVHISTLDPSRWR